MFIIYKRRNSGHIHTSIDWWGCSYQFILQRTIIFPCIYNKMNNFLHYISTIHDISSYKFWLGVQIHINNKWNYVRIRETMPFIIEDTHRVWHIMYCTPEAGNCFGLFAWKVKWRFLCVIVVKLTVRQRNFFWWLEDASGWLHLSEIFIGQNHSPEKVTWLKVSGISIRNRKKKEAKINLKKIWNRFVHFSAFKKRLSFTRKNIG